MFPAPQIITLIEKARTSRIPQMNSSGMILSNARVISSPGRPLFVLLAIVLKSADRLDLPDMRSEITGIERYWRLFQNFDGWPLAENRGSKLE